MTKDLRNCRNCFASYKKSTDGTDTDDFWCEVPLIDNEKKIIEPIGFCDLCDKNNKTWYMPERQARTTGIKKWWN